MLSIYHSKNNICFIWKVNSNPVSLKALLDHFFKTVYLKSSRIYIPMPLEAKDDGTNSNW